MPVSGVCADSRGYQLALISGAHLAGAPNHLSSRTLKQWSLASLGDPDIFPNSVPASCGALAPFRLCSCSQPQSSPWDLTSETQASAPSPHPPWWLSRQASRAGECWSSVQESLHFALRTPVAALSSVAPKLTPPNPPSPPVKGLPSVWKIFLLHSSLTEVQVLSLFFCLCFLFFLLLYTVMWGVSCLLGSLRSSASVQ